MDAHAAAIGHIAIAWNNLHHTFGEIFIDLVAPKNPRMGWAIWRSAESDAAARDMLFAVSRATRKRKIAFALQELRWVLKTVPSADRNAAIHTPYGLQITDTEIIVLPLVRGTKTLTRKNLQTRLAAYERRIRAAYNFTLSVQKTMESGGRSPLSQRPRLLYKSNGRARRSNKRTYSSAA